MFERFDEILTDRQAGVARALLRGDSVKEIAQALSLSPSTVQEHKRAALAKLGCEDTRELFEKFAPEGIESGIYGRSRYTGSPKRVSERVPGQHFGDRNDTGVRTFRDAATFGQFTDTEHRVVPEALDGKDAVRNRLVMMVKLLVGILAIIALLLTVFQSLGEMV